MKELISEESLDKFGKVGGYIIVIGVMWWAFGLKGIIYGFGAALTWTYIEAFLNGKR